MRIMINQNVYGWWMTGLLGKEGKWFIGFSRQPKHGPMHCRDHDGYGFRSDCVACNADEEMIELPSSISSADEFVDWVRAQPVAEQTR